MGDQLSDIALLRGLFDFVPTGVLVADDRAVYVLANRAACALLGRSSDQVVGRHLSEIVAPGRKAEVDVQWRAFVRDGAQRGMFVFNTPGGAERSVHFEAVANVFPGRHCSFLSPAPAEGEPQSHRPPWLTLCAWTKKVRVADRWMAIEEYLDKHHGVTVTHGICPEAFESAMANDDHPR